MRVSRHDRPEAESFRQLAKRGVPASVTAKERALELDEEVLRAHSTGQPSSRVRIAKGKAGSSAAREADEPFVRLLELCERQTGLEPLSRMRGREQAAERRVAELRLNEKRDVRAVF